MELVGDYLRGYTDTIILSILEKGDSYGYEINKTISEFTDGQFSLTEATLYTSFKRLEQGKYISSYWRKGLNQTRRKYYSITDRGQQYLKEKRGTWERVKVLLDKLIR